MKMNVYCMGPHTCTSKSSLHSPTIRWGHIAHLMQFIYRFKLAGVVGVVIVSFWFNSFWVVHSHGKYVGPVHGPTQTFPTMPCSFLFYILV